MDIHINFYWNDSPKNAINKNLFWPGYQDARITSPQILQGTFKEDTSFKAPSIEILWETENNPYGAMAIFNVYNYVFIQELNAYYYIGDKILEENNIIRLELELDPLMTYRNSILASKGRAESYSGSNEKDINNNTITARESGFTKIFKFPNEGFDNAGGFILLTAGPGLAATP